MRGHAARPQRPEPWDSWDRETEAGSFSRRPRPPPYRRQSSTADRARPPQPQVFFDYDDFDYDFGRA